MKIFEVIQFFSIFDHMSLGLFDSEEKAIECAEKKALEHNFNKEDNALFWGEKDDYGILEGVLITHRTVL